MDRIETGEIKFLLEAGADAVTKFPAIKLFNSEHAKKIEEQALQAGRTFVGTMTKVPSLEGMYSHVDSLDFNTELKEGIKKKILSYHKKMAKNSASNILRENHF